LVELLTLPSYNPIPIKQPNIGIAIMAFQPDQTKYKLCYFVPPSSLQSTKDAIFATHLAGIFSSLTDANKTLYTDVVSLAPDPLPMPAQYLVEN
jgi:hypothetical protein